MLFVDPEEQSFEAWEAALAPGFRFDYGEGRLRITVEVERVSRGELVELALRVVDDAHSRREPPRRGDTFVASYHRDVGPFYVWKPFAAGYFARRAAWERAHR